MMEFEAVSEIARTLNMPPMVIAYLAWLGMTIYKKNKQLDTAFTKIRALEKTVRNMGDKNA